MIAPINRRAFITLRRRGRVVARGACAAGRTSATDRVLVRRREPSRCSPYVWPLVLVFFMA
jgi:hypothetical protein